MAWYVISIGGHLLHRGAESIEELDLKWYEEYAEIVKVLYKRGNRIAVVTGGGDIAREEIEKAKEEGVTDKSKLDLIGIKWTHYNAKRFGEVLGDIASIHLKPESEIKKILDDIEKNKIPVCGGERVGHSTDYDSIFIAGEAKKRRGKDVIFIDARKHPIYDKNPAKYKDAKKIGEISPEELIELGKKTTQEPGGYEIDIDAIRLLKRYKEKGIDIRGVVIDGYTDPNEIIRAVEGTHNGTVIE